MKMRAAKILLFIAVVTVMCSPAWAAPAGCAGWDSSQNGSLNGNYYFRQILWSVGDQLGDLADGIAVYGEVTFDGKGGYLFSGTIVDGAQGSVNVSNQTGTYTVSASGYACVDSFAN